MRSSERNGETHSNIISIKVHKSYKDWGIAHGIFSSILAFQDDLRRKNNDCPNNYNVAIKLKKEQKRVSKN